MRFPFLPLTAALASIGETALANSLLIKNASFEELSGTNPTHFGATGKLLAGHYSFSAEPPDIGGFQLADPVPSWATEGEVGTIAPRVGTAPAAEFASLPSGQNSLFLKAGSSVFQQLADLAEPGFRLTLRAKAGRPRSAAAQAGWGGADLTLSAGGFVIITAKVPNDLAAGQFAEIGASYSVVSGDVVAGKTLLIAIGAGGCDGIHFDEISLETEPMVLPQATIQPAVEIAWNSKVSESYRIERASRLVNPDWTQVSGVLKGTGGRMSLFQVAAQTESFYRVVPAPPQ